MKGFFERINEGLYIRLFIAFALACVLPLAGCSSSDSGGGGSIPIAAPVEVAATLDSSNDIIVVQFNRSSGMGPENALEYPIYQYALSTAPDGEKTILDVSIANAGNPIRLYIASEGADTSAISFTTVRYPLVPNVMYYVWVRAVYPTYGTSAWSSTIAAVTIPPVPSPVDNPKVEVGDRRIVVSWNAKPGEQYGVNLDDCPRRSGQLTPNFWSLANIVEGDNIVFTVDNNTAAHKLCMASTNARGNGEWHIFGVVDREAGTIAYTEYTAAAAAQPPAAPSGLAVAREYSTALDLTFNSVLTGDASVSDYQYSYRASGQGDWSAWTSINISNMTDRSTGAVKFSVLGLTNDQTYEVKVRALNTVNQQGVESTPVSGTPRYIPVDYNDPNTVLSKANAEFIYAEDVPHSDFWRISSGWKQGGRPNTDRLVRGKETAIGNLFADALQWYAVQKGHAPDFSWLVGDMISTGIAYNANITPRLLNGILGTDYKDDTVVIARVPGSLLISQMDYDLPLDAYPAVGTNNGYASTIFGQAASVYRNGHYGGSGGTTYNGAYWGIPSAQARYTIEYLPYSLDEFNTHFNSKPECVAARDANDGAYDVQTDPLGCYLLTYEQAWPASGSPTASSVLGYKRGRIKKPSEDTPFENLTINGEAVDPARTYTIATTKRIADVMYVAFLRGNYVDTGVTLTRAVSEYLYDNTFSTGVTPRLDGRVKIKGGVPGNTASDFKE